MGKRKIANKVNSVRKQPEPAKDNRYNETNKEKSALNKAMIPSGTGHKTMPSVDKAAAAVLQSTTAASIAPHSSAKSSSATVNCQPPRLTTSHHVSSYHHSPSTSCTTLPPPPPDPIFVLRGATSPVTCVQFLTPTLRLKELTPSQSEALHAAYSSPDQPVSDGRQHSAPLLKLPPPGFLSPTTHIAVGLQNGQVIVWDLKSKQQSLCWQAHPPDAAVLAIKSLSSCTLITLGRRDSLKLWSIDLTDPNTCEAKGGTSAAAEGAGDKAASGDTSSTDSSAEASSSTISEKKCSPKGSGRGKGGSWQPVCKTQIPLGDYLGFSACDVFRQVNCIVAAIPGGSQDAVSVWSVDDRIKICQLRVNETSKVGSVMQLKWVEKRCKVSLLVAYESGDLCLWDWSNRDLHSVACIQGTPVSLEYDQSLGSGVLGTTEDGIFIFNISNNLHLSIVKEITITNEGIGCCLSRPDSKIYATGGWDNRIRIFSWQKHRPLGVLHYHTNSVSCLHYSASRVVTYDGAGPIGTEAELGSTKAGPISAGAEHMLAAGSLDGSVSLWKTY